MYDTLYRGDIFQFISVTMSPFKKEFYWGVISFNLRVDLYLLWRQRHSWQRCLSCKGIRSLVTAHSVGHEIACLIALDKFLWPSIFFLQCLQRQNRLFHYSWPGHHKALGLQQRRLQVSYLPKYLNVQFRACKSLISEYFFWRFWQKWWKDLR